MNACCDAVSIVIPVWNEELFLLRLLELLRRHLPSSEIIVADHNSQDRSRQIAGQFGCKIVAGGRPGMARNAGAAAASGKIIVFLDADVVFGASEINKMLAYFSDREVVCVHPRLTPMSDDAYILTCYAVVDLYFRFYPRVNLSQGLGGVIALRKSAFDVVEGFSEELTVGEDADFFPAPPQRWANSL